MNETSSKEGEFRGSLQATDWAWLAGFIDGEGHLSVKRGFQVNKKKTRKNSQESWTWFSPRLSVHNTCHEAMVIAGAMLNGNVVERKLQPSNLRPMYSIEIVARDKLLRVLPLLIPHMRVKRKMAELLLELVSLPRGSGPLKDDIWRRSVILSQASDVRVS